MVVGVWDEEEEEGGGGDNAHTHKRRPGQVHIHGLYERTQGGRRPGRGQGTSARASGARGRGTADAR